MSGVDTYMVFSEWAIENNAPDFQLLLSLLALVGFVFLLICQTAVRLGRAYSNHIMLFDRDARGLQTSVVAHALLDPEGSECWVA